MKELAQITVCLIPKGFKPDDTEKETVANELHDILAQKIYYGYEDHKWILPKDHFDHESNSFIVDAWSMQVEPLGETSNYVFTALESSIDAVEYDDFKPYFDDILNDAKEIIPDWPTKATPTVVKFIGLFNCTSGMDRTWDGDEFWCEVQYLGRVNQQLVQAKLLEANKQ